MRAMMYLLLGILLGVGALVEARLAEYTWKQVSAAAKQEP